MGDRDTKLIASSKTAQEQRQERREAKGRPLEKVHQEKEKTEECLKGQKIKKTKSRKRERGGGEEYILEAKREKISKSKQVVWCAQR